MTDDPKIEEKARHCDICRLPDKETKMITLPPVNNPANVKHKEICPYCARPMSLWVCSKCQSGTPKKEDKTFSPAPPPDPGTSIDTTSQF